MRVLPEADDRALNGLTARLEALLLVGGANTTIETLARVLDRDEQTVIVGLEALNAYYVEQERGLRVLRAGEQVQLGTAPDCSDAVSRFLGAPAQPHLSPAAWETVAIVAYRQPVTRTEVERIRGVNCDHVLRVLLNDGLIEERGRADAPGRPTLYGTTAGFLQALGLRSLDELPPLPDLDT